MAESRPPFYAEPRGLPMPFRITADEIAELDSGAQAAHARDFMVVAEQLSRRGSDPDAVVTEVARFSVAAPSWAVGTGGTRFGRFPMGGEPRDTYEKVDDVAALNALTGANRTISLHVPWDNPADPEDLRWYALGRGVHPGAV